MDYSYTFLFIVIIASFVTNFIFAVSGGVGLLLRPILFFIGVPIHLAIGSTRLASVISATSKIFAFQKSKKIDWHLAIFLFVPSFVGGVIAAYYIVSLNEELLEKIVGILILAMGITLFVKKDFGIEKIEYIKNKIFRNVFGFFFMFIAAFIGTFTGGAGIIGNYTLVFAYGKTLIESSAIRTVSGFGSLSGGALYFIYSNTYDLYIVLCVALGGIIGAYFGVNYGIKKGDHWVKFILFIVIAMLSVKLLL